MTKFIFIFVLVLSQYAIAQVTKNTYNKAKDALKTESQKTLNPEFLFIMEADENFDVEVQNRNATCKLNSGQKIKITEPIEGEIAMVSIYGPPANGTSCKTDDRVLLRTMDLVNSYIVAHLSQY